MKAKLLCYSLRKLNPSVKVKICRELYGYKNYSNYGKYVYKRKGVLDTVKHKKILNSIIITNKENMKIIVDILKKYNVKYYVFDVLVKFKV